MLVIRATHYDSVCLSGNTYILSQIHRYSNGTSYLNISILKIQKLVDDPDNNDSNS